MLHHPYENLPPSSEWLKGNLHAHTTRSDGSSDPQDAIDEYARKGFDFLSITDHDICTTGKDYAQWDSRGMTLIDGNEISANGPHILHVGATELIEPEADRTAVVRKAAAAGGLVIANHPNWGTDFDHCPDELLLRLEELDGIEIFNGIVTILPGSPYATNRWDRLLASGKKLWGFAHDDSHRGPVDIGVGWIVACTADRSATGILETLRQGRFYSSTGVTVENISVSGDTIRIDTKDAERVTALRDYGARIAQADGKSIEVTVPKEGATYVRFECWGRGERFAWTQPFFVV